MKKCDLIGTGRNRIVYRRGNVVIKYPIKPEGEYDNRHEANMFRQYGKSGFIPYARCRMFKGYILVMEYVEHIGWQKNQPRWCDFVDCGQIGKDAKGQLVAYDYGRF